jgi:hypothetical protein
MKKKKLRRSVQASRSASLKGWRTRKRMLSQRELDERERRPISFSHWALNGLGATLDDMLPPERTIDRIPKVEWR